MKQTAGVGEAQPEIASRREGPEGAARTEDREGARDPSVRLDAGVGRQHCIQLRERRFSRS